MTSCSVAGEPSRTEQEKKGGRLDITAATVHRKKKKKLALIHTVGFHLLAVMCIFGLEKSENPPQKSSNLQYFTLT